jgi:hypothetical protein
MAAGAPSLHEGGGLDSEDLMTARESQLNHASTAAQAAEEKE